MATRSMADSSSPHLSKRWAELTYRIHEVDRLTCGQSGAQMKIVPSITEPTTIDMAGDVMEALKRRRGRRSGSFH